MKAIFSLRKHLYVKRVGIFLIAIALIVGTVGCEAAGDEVEPLDHATLYMVNWWTAPDIDEEVYLEDQFCAVHATVEYAGGFVIPAQKVHGDETTPILNPDHCLTSYYISYEEEPQEWFVEVENQFGLQELTVRGPYGLAVPTRNEGHQSPVGLDHYLLYYVDDYTYLDEVSVELNDEFLDEPLVSEVYEPAGFAVPVKKTHGGEVTEILNPDVHAVIYVTDSGVVDKAVDVVNQFGEQTLDVDGPYALIVPSEKIDYWQEEVYDLTMAANPTGSGTATDLTGSSPYAEGTDVSIKAVASAGYEFAGWAAPAGAFADAGAAETTFTMPGQDVTVTANFVPLYDLTMAVDPAAGGTATDETSGSPYAEGADVSIKAVPDTGYEFAGWTAPAGTFADDDAAETTFTMPGQDVTVTANFVLVYDLTMAVNPVGGGTATDETGTSPYRAGTDVDIKAVANPPYQFFEWTAPAGTFADAGAAETTFTMPDEDVTATASFVGPLDHFTGYEVDWETAPHIGEEVYLEDQFGAFNVTVGDAVGFGNPAHKVHGEETPILNPDHHYVAYEVSYNEGEPQYYLVTVSNQFGENQVLYVYGPFALAVPTQKDGHEAPLGLDHYLIYEVVEGPSIDEWVSLDDQFGPQPEVLVSYPVGFANPVKKTHGDEVTEILDLDTHVVFYYTEGAYFEETVQVSNQFGEQTLDVDGPYGLGVPSQKIDWEPILEHFRWYGIDFGTEPFVDEFVQLQDQFHDEPFDAYVGEGVAFCNPADKYHWDTELYYPAIHSEYHLMVYNLYHEELPEVWEVTVDNQFGGEQVLWVTGPVALAVPTHKLFPDDFGPPVGLDHFLLYEVLDYTVVPGVLVELMDQFAYEPEVWVDEPVLFANPVQKTFLGEVTEIENPDWHAVFYIAFGAPLGPPAEVFIENQFGPWGFTVTWPDLLGVPSAKIGWVPLGPL